MNAEQAKKAKELFLSEIDSKDFTDDERLMIAHEGWDMAFKLGENANTTHEQGLKIQIIGGHANKPGDELLYFAVSVPNYKAASDEDLLDKAAGIMLKMATLGNSQEVNEDDYLELIVKVRAVGQEIKSRFPDGNTKLQERINALHAQKPPRPTLNAANGGVKVTGDNSNTIVGEKRPEVIETKNGSKIEVVDNAKDAVKKAMENKVVEQEPTPDKPKATRKSRAKSKN